MCSSWSPSQGPCIVAGIDVVVVVVVVVVVSVIGGIFKKETKEFRFHCTTGRLVRRRCGKDLRAK